MYRHVKKIPTILGVLIILSGIGAALYLDRFSQSLTSKAEENQIPTDIHFTNITDNSFTVSWMTQSAVTGGVSINNGFQKLTYLDDLDSDNVPRPRTTHLVTIKNLKEESSYDLKLISAGLGCSKSALCPAYTQKTGKKMDSKVDLPPLHGTIVNKDGNPAYGALVYLVAEKSSPLSGRVDTAGLYVLPLNNLRTADLAGRPNLEDHDILQISGFASLSDTTSAVTDIKSIRQNFTIPKMMLGNSYNFIDLISKIDIIAKTSNEYILGDATSTNPSAVSATASSKSAIEILFPKKNNDVTSDTRPRIRGIGTPGQQLLITVNSTPQTAKVTVGKDGVWYYRPGNDLPPGIHHLSVNGFDKKGKSITVNRTFMVLKSGEAVLGESTPSASLTPTNIPISTPTITPLTPTVTPSVTPTTTPTTTPTPSVFSSATISIQPPRSGNTTPTIFLGLWGLLLISAGLKFIFFP